MTSIKLKYIDRFVDRHGRERFYFRRDRGPRIALQGRPGTPEFMAAYERAAIGEVSDPGPKLRGTPGTFDRLTQDYFAASEFISLAASTQRSYRSVIERMIAQENIGHRLVREMSREHVRRIIAKRSSTPGAANTTLKLLKILSHFAIDNGWRRDDPTQRIKKFRLGEVHTWTEDELARFERTWPVGSTERLAYALLLYTGQRRSDAVGMSWDDVRDGSISVVPLKTKRSTGVKLWIPIHPALAEVLDACRREGQTILTTSFGKPFTGSGFGNFMAAKIEEACLSGRCVTHGLRKAAARRLAEAGCSANEIASITGHTTLAEVARYTKAAEQKTLAQSAMRRLSPPKPPKDSQPSPKSLGITPKIVNDSKPLGDDWRSRRV